MLSSNKLFWSLILSSGLTFTACSKQDNGKGNARGRGARPAVNSTNKTGSTSNDKDKNADPSSRNPSPQSSDGTDSISDIDLNPNTPSSSDVDTDVDTDSTARAGHPTTAKPKIVYDANEKGVSVEEMVVSPHEDSSNDNIQVEKNDPRPVLPEPAPKVAADKDTTSEKATGSQCSVLDKQLKELNWERKELEVPESPAQKDSKKIKISYYIQSQKEMKNPVFLIQDYFQPISAEGLKYLNEISKRYSLNLVTMDPRGAGCSSGLPPQDELSRWQDYGSRSLAHDIELIRKTLLQDKKWKVLAHGTGGYVALRIAELYPQGIKSLHTADFTPMKSFTEYMKLRLEAQKEAWESFVSFVDKEKKLSVTEAEIKKAQSTLDKAECDDSQKICGTALFDLLSYVLKSSLPSVWDQAAEVLKNLIHGEQDKTDSLKSRALNLQKRYLMVTAVRMIDMDSDLEQKACMEALKDEDLKSSPISSCRVEIALGRAEVDQLKSTLKHEPLNHEKIKKNLAQNKIDYHFAIADRSLFNPIKAAHEHIEQYKDVLKNQDFITIPKTSEAAFRSEILQTLK